MIRKCILYLKHVLFCKKKTGQRLFGVDCNQNGGNSNENNQKGNNSSSCLDNENDANTPKYQSEYESGQKQILELRKMVQKLIKEKHQS